MMRTRVPRRVSQSATTSPVGPAPAIRTGTLVMAGPFALFGLSGCVFARIDPSRRSEIDHVVIAVKDELACLFVDGCRKVLRGHAPSEPCSCSVGVPRP